MPLAGLSSICIGVVGCGCHNSAQVTHRGSNCLVFIYEAPISASAADNNTPFIVSHIIDIGPLIIYLFVGLFPRDLYPAALDLASVATKYDVCVVVEYHVACSI